MSKLRQISVWVACAALVSVAQAGQTVEVSIEGMKFEPQNVTLQPGDTVVWHNRDLVPHTATSMGVFDTGPIAAGASKSWTATQAGRYDYICSFHPGMRASLSVQ